MVSKSEIMAALKPVIDPEIGMSVVDLGMIREVEIDGGKVEVKMVLTAPMCPLADYLTEQVRLAAESVEGVDEATVILLEERWDPSWIGRAT